MKEQTDYMRYRGKCKKYCERAVRLFPSLQLKRGHYFDWQWGEQAHWWCVRPNGSIFDPTAKQFPSKGSGDYVEFDGTVSCSECGKIGNEDDFRHEGRYSFCSDRCNMIFVGII